MQRRILIAACRAALRAAIGGAWAQAFPTKPVKLGGPFAPRRTAAILARVLAERIGGPLGQRLIVEIQAGGGSVGATETSQATPGGYAFGMATVSSTAANPAINPKFATNPLTGSTRIINVAATPNVIAVHPSLPQRDYEGFLAQMQPEQFPAQTVAEGLREARETAEADAGVGL